MSNEMMAITLWQPWASLIAVGLKRYETRHWPTWYRRKLLIHAAKRKMTQKDKVVWALAHRLAEIPEPSIDELPHGAIVAIADLTGCFKMGAEYSWQLENIQIDEQSALERSVGNWAPGRFAWQLENIQPIDPIECKGGQSFWFPPQDVLEKIQGVNHGR